MALTVGTRLGPYEILSPLGAGGMGEVYLASDSKLDRKVAIKILSESMATDKERVARFEREAKLLASLNHPNIAAIHGFDDSDGTTLLVMEYVEGETLAGHLKGGPVAVEDALDLAKQIAEALEAAHGQGVIHRDLKPANVMIREDGSVKVLDFGLAKAVHEDPSGSEVAHSPTITADFTRPGVVLGTAAYMSPEQARGRPLDKRTDIWSFGVILFECLTGETLFRGETATDSMGAIMHKEPEWSLLPPNTPPTIQLLLRRCLTKDRKRRLHDIADARIELENALVDPASTSLGLARAALEIKTRWLPPWPVAVAFGMVAALAALGAWYAKPEQPKQVWNLTLGVPKDLGYELVNFGGGIAISPDGRYVVFTVMPNAERTAGLSSRLFLRQTDQPQGAILPDTEDAVDACFSPDGKWIAFSGRHDCINKISVSGGPASTIYRMDGKGRLRYPQWGDDGTIVFLEWRPGEGTSLRRVSASGGPVEILTTTNQGDPFYYKYVHFLPDGSGVIYSAGGLSASWDDVSILALRFGKKQPTEVMKGGSNAVVLPTGHLVYLRDGSLMAAPFDATSLKPTGPGIPVLDGIGRNRAMAGARMDVARNGTLVYIPQGNDPFDDLTLNWIDFDGTMTPMSKHLVPCRALGMSPDGKYVAVANADLNDRMNLKLYLLEIERDLPRPLTDGVALGSSLVWTPDGQWIIYAGKDPKGDAKKEGTGIFRIRADFTGKPERLSASDWAQYPSDISPDGRLLAVTDFEQGKSPSVLLQPLNEQGRFEGEPTLLDESGERHSRATFSPDGKWIAYARGGANHEQVYVKPVTGGAAIQVSTESGSNPHWSPVEHKLYMSGAGHLVSVVYSVSYTVEDGIFRPALPERLMTFQGAGAYPDNFQMAPDGKRFLFALNKDAEKKVHIDPKIIVNWFEELKAKVPIERHQ